MFGVKQIILAILIGLIGAAGQTNQSSDAARIHAQGSSELIAWLNREQLPEDLTDRDPSFQDAICDELAARREVDFLLASLNTPDNENAQEWLVPSVLSRIDDHRIYDAFVHRLNDKEDRESFYVALYLAERGNPAAIATLNRHYFQYEVASFEWSPAVDVFGKYKYMPGSTNLIDSLDAASLNLSCAAYNALQEIFPDSPKYFSGPAAAKNYYIKRLKLD